MDMGKVLQPEKCGCGRETRYPSTGECSACYRRRRLEESPEARERARVTSRAWKEANQRRRKEYDRVYLEQHRGKCGSCGGAMGQREDGICLPCRRAHHKAQCELVVRWWADGRSLIQIEDVMGWSRGGAGPRMAKMRHEGYDLPLRRKRTLA